MEKSCYIKPYILIGAGDIVKRNLDALGWTQEDLAEITELSGKTISQIITNKQKISVETAKLLSNAFETSPEYWLNLDNNYRLNLPDNKQKIENIIKKKAEIRKYMPVLEIYKKGWFKTSNKTRDYEELYKKIWDVTSLDFSFYDGAKKFCARQSKENEDFTYRYSYTWYQIAKKHSRNFIVPKYDMNKLEKISKNLTKYTIQENGVNEIIKSLNAAGVKFFVQSHLSKTYLDGACFFEEENPVIVYTARYDRIDNFWFTLAHEIAHILLHLSKNKDYFSLDDFDHKDTSISKIEKEADSKAEEILKVKEIIELSKPFINYFTDATLLNISNKLKIEVSVILGILQHNGYVEYKKLSRYKKKVKDLFPQNILVG